jgi:hypothetical protein
VGTHAGRVAARVRNLVKRLLRANAGFRVSKQESSESLLERARQSPRLAKPSADEELMQRPEVREKLREALLGHYTGWLDTELPILGKRTPRQAVRDADGSEAVEALIAQIERDAQKKTPPLDPDITQMLRRELGLPVDPLAREGSGAWGSPASKPICARSRRRRCATWMTFSTCAGLATRRPAAMRPRSFPSSYRPN